MKKLLILLAFVCIGLNATAQNYVGLSRTEVVEYIKEDYKDFSSSVKIYKDSVMCYSKMKGILVTEVRYFKNDTCYKQVIKSDNLSIYNEFYEDCAINFDKPISKDTWITKNIYKDNYYYIVTIRTINNEMVYMTNGYSNFLDYLCDLVLKQLFI